MAEAGLYRFYDEQDTLLYVGCSVNPFSRFASHRDKERERVRHMEIEWFQSKASALKAEAIAIRREKPLWNKQIPKPPLRNQFSTPSYTGKHFGVCADVEPDVSLKVARWFPMSNGGLERALKVSRGGDVLHLAPDIHMPDDLMSRAIEGGIYVWQHRDIDKEAFGT